MMRELVDLLIRNLWESCTCTCNLQEVVSSVCPSNINLCAPFRLVEVLHDFGSSDWQLATLVCKILWNCRYVHSV